LTSPGVEAGAYEVVAVWATTPPTSVLPVDIYVVTSVTIIVVVKYEYCPLPASEVTAALLSTHIASLAAFVPQLWVESQHN
jgi:hypothetical protein